MTIATCAVHCSIVDDTGTPVDGATITAKLNSFEVYQGYITPREVQVVTGVDGLATLNLWPNQLGSLSSNYNITITLPDGSILSTTAIVPNTSSANLHEISLLPPYPGKVDGQLVFEAVLQAGSMTAAKANEAANSATTASTKATEAATSATNSSGSASLAATSATTAATSATTATDRATAAATSATNAATSATTSEISSTAASAAKVAAESAKTSALGSASAAATSASTATTKANEAAASATSASTSATTATTKASEAGTSATQATTSATNASQSASSASTSASTSAASALTATEKSTAAATSATNAATSATNAATSSTSAANSATSANNAKVSAESAKDSALGSATAAATSAAIATTKATEAGTSATTATTSANTATTKAGEASASAAAAAASAISTAADRAATAASATSAATSATSAANSATSAANRANSASTSATSAANSATDAQIAALSAQAYALQAGGNINDIGTPGRRGFGVGVTANVSGFATLSGTTDPASENYGNYQFSDGSVMVYIPAFYYKYGTGSNGLAVNVVDVKPFGAYDSLATASDAGYALHRAFYNAGVIWPGVFVDKYQCSNNGGMASSIRNGYPLSSASGHNPFSTLFGSPPNIYAGAIIAAKTRGESFFCNTRFIHAALALLANAHAAASTNNTYCAWYNLAANFPKGNNNNAFGDSNDTIISYASDGYLNAGRTGSANIMNRVSHNGQMSGVMDLNGNMGEVNLGLTSDGTNYYLLKTSADVSAITSGTTLATDAWGATGLAAMYDNLGATYGAMTASNSVKNFGAAGQVLSNATSGNAWAAAGAGIPLATGTGGSNQFGNDGMWDFKPNELCVVSGGGWGNGSGAGVWALNLGGVRGTSTDSAGFRAALYSLNDVSA